MVIRFGGGTSGIVEYLETGQKSGREYSRDELDKRLILSGEMRHLDEVLNKFSNDDETQHYMHITLSFKERKVDEETLRAIDKEFHQFIFASLGRSDEFYYYSEAHLPKIKRLKDMNGEDYERFPHIHIVIPQYNLYTDKRDDPVGLHNPIIPYIDAFQEYINAKYNLASPKDNRRLFKLGREGSINRKRLSEEEVGRVKNYISSYRNRQAVKNEIFNIIRADKSISSVEELAKVLEALGEVKIRDSKKFGQKYINFRLKDYPDKKAINLKDNVFLDDYLKTRNLKDTQTYATEHNTDLLQEWYSKVAFERRFVMKLSPKDREAYFAGDETYQRQVIDQQIAIHQKLLQSMDYTEPVEKSSPRQISQLPYWRQNIVHMNQIPHMNDIPHMNEIRHMNDIPHMNDLPVMGVDNPPPFYVEYDVLNNLDKENSNERQHNERNHRDDGRHTHAIEPTTHTQRQYHQESGHTLPDLPSSRSNPQRSGGQQPNDRADFLHSPTFDDLDIKQSKPHKGVFQLPNQRRVKQRRMPTSPTQLEQMWQGIVAHHQLQQKEFMHKINAIDCRVLLDMCSVKYGLSASDFNISINPYGNDRIQVDNKTLNAAEFLQQYMNLSHTESEQIIDNTLQQQKIGFRQRSPVSGLMWARFNREEAAELAKFKQLRQRYRSDKGKIFANHRWVKILGETPAQAMVRRKYLKEQRDYQLQALQEQYRPLFKEAKKPNERYCEWLHKQAVSGSLNALLELQRVYPHYKEQIDEDNHWLSFQSKSDEIPYPRQHAPDFGLSVFIHKNGTIDYRDEHGKTLISNAYNAVIVKEKTAENIAKALQIAQAKFGKDGFEIVNASLRDIATIQAAVDKTQIAVSVQKTDNKVRIERGKE